MQHTKPGFLNLAQKRFQQVHLQHILRIIREYSGGSKSHRLVPAESSLLRRTIGHVKAVTGVSFVMPTGKKWVLTGKGRRENNRRNGDDESRFGDRRKHFVSWRAYHEPTGKRVRPLAAFAHYQSDRVNLSLQSAFERTELRDAARESLRSQWCSNSAWKLKNTRAGFMASN